MPICQGCGASYDDNYKFCPNCGRAKPEPQAINLNVRVAPVRYEEAVLKMEVVGTAELTEPPFDYRPSGLTKLMGDGGKNWTQIAILRLLLESMHPDKKKYLAFSTGTFRGFLKPDLKLPTTLYTFLRTGKFSESRQKHKWLLDLVDERRRRWEEFNGYLVSEGWVGLTQRATDREAPFTDDPNALIDHEGKLHAFFQSMLLATNISYLLSASFRGEAGDMYDFGREYRYRRSVA